MTNPIALKMEQLVITYFDACSTDDVTSIAACFAPGAVHYLPNHPPLIGGDAIGTFIVEHLRNLGGEYFLDRILTNVEQCAAAVEWSRTFRESDRILRGFEFYEFDPASILIREVRGYFAAGPNPRRHAMNSSALITPAEAIKRCRAVSETTGMSGREVRDFAPGLHVAAGRAANVSAYEGWVGRWSRLFVPMVISAAQIAPGQRVLDVSTGTGEAALKALPAVSASGTVIGADIAPAMLVGARDRLADPLFYPVAADGQVLPFMNGAFDAVICQLGLQFFPDPARGLAEFYRVLKPGCRAAVCVISTPDRAPMFGVLADVLSRFVPQQRDFLHLSFALADANRLERMFISAGFHEVRVERVQREDAIASYDAYWSPIETGMDRSPRFMSLCRRPTAAQCGRR